ncbi:L-threonylcarbamoyladenylate synthase [Kalamiella sp. sgz302252]|uniref:L-threonylcarbamoyladenylate synthase n=1 Tax=Pantoea sp. sgz302252 TaxID=3341827 RepID=UPI0036D4357B
MSFIDLAVACLKQDGVLLAPTDTHYALAISPYSLPACRRLRSIKQSDEQATLCVAQPQQLDPWVTLNVWQRQQVQALAQRYWPGPLKLLLPKAAEVPEHQLITDGAIAVVCTNNKLLNATIAALGHPLIVLPATRAGSGTGLVSLTAARDSYGDLVDMVIPSNNRNVCSWATTFVSLLHNRLDVLRRGDVVIEPELCVA